MAVPERCSRHLRQSKVIVWYVQLSVFMAIPSGIVRSIGCNRIWMSERWITVFSGEVGQVGRAK